MRCENKPLLQDHAGFLQEITPITVEVGLAPEHTRVELSDNPGKHGVNIATLALSRRKAQRGAEAVSPGCIDPGVSASILDPIRAITESEAPALGPRLEIGQNPANREFTKLRRPICGITGILVDKNPARNRISANCTVIARGSTFCQRGGVQCLSLIHCGFPVHSS